MEWDRIIIKGFKRRFGLMGEGVNKGGDGEKKNGGGVVFTVGPWIRTMRDVVRF